MHLLLVVLKPSVQTLLSLELLRINMKSEAVSSTSKHHRNEDTIKLRFYFHLHSASFDNISQLAPNTDIYPYFALETPLLTPNTLPHTLLLRADEGA